MRMIGIFRVGSDAVMRVGQNGDFLTARLAYSIAQGKRTVWVSVMRFGTEKSLSFGLDVIKKGVVIFAILRDVEPKSWTAQDGSQRLELSGVLDYFETLSAIPQKPKDQANDDDIPF